MSCRTARPLLQATREQATTRTFSTSASCSSPKFSPLHKTSIARAERAARGQGKAGQRGKEKQSMTLEEAHKVLQVGSSFPFHSSFEITKRDLLLTRHGHQLLLMQLMNSTSRRNLLRRSN